MSLNSLDSTQKSVTDADVEAVEKAVGMGHGAWDMVDPKELIRVVRELANA